MSSKEWKFRVQDILSAIDKIERYVGSSSITEFKKNELVIDAVIRNFEIIGEASKSVPRHVRQTYSHIPWSKMCGMRDVLIHEYSGVDLKILWHATKKELPSLRKHLLSLLETSSQRLQD